LKEKHTGTIVISVTSVKLAETIYVALAPELNGKTEMNRKEDQLTLSFKADTLSTLRATCNSYLRWIGMINQISEFLMTANISDKNTEV